MYSYYERSNNNSFQQKNSRSHSGSKKCGKIVAQLGEQIVQSIAPLKVNTGQLIITDEQRAFAKDMGLTIEQYLDIDAVSTKPAPRREYAKGEPMVNEEEEKLLSTQMRRLHKWYMTEAILFDLLGFWIPIRREYFDNGTGDLWIANEELFQFHQLLLDKSIVSCYCL